MQKRESVGAMLGLVFMAVVALFLSGCAGKTEGNGGSVLQNPPEEEQGPSPLYLDFGDVLIPNELAVSPKNSFVYRTPSTSAGVLVLSGKVEVGSLVSFFESNMVKDNWRIVSSFKSPRTIMLFHKENRWCIININQSNFRAQVEIWVAPTADGFQPNLVQ